MKQGPAHPFRPSGLVQRCALWMLIAAWICANSPQAATYALISWIAHSPHFAHQQQLKRDVAFLLAGESAPASVVAQDVGTEREDLPPALPAAAVLKKMDLAHEAVMEASEPRQPFHPLARYVDGGRGRSRSAPPHEPPRARVTV